MIMRNNRSVENGRGSFFLARADLGVFIVLTMGAVLNAGTDAPTPTVEELASHNDATLARVKRIAFTMHDTAHYYQDGRESRSPLVNTWIWTRAGGKERLRTGDPSQLDDEGHPTELSDVFIDGVTVYRLSNWDPEHPFPINPAKTRVSGMVDVYTGKALNNNALRILGWSLSFTGGEEIRRTFLELVRTSPKVELVGSATVDGHSCWELRLAHPGLPSEPLTGCYFRVFLDPAVGHLPRRVVQHWTLPSPPAAPSENRSQNTEITIKAFANPEPEVWVPTDIETNIDLVPDNGFHETIVTTVRDLLVNDPRVDEKLAFAFPENCLVSFPSTDPDRNNRVLWGKNNQPGKKIRRYEDIPGADSLAGPAAAPAPIAPPVAERSFPWLIVINAGALVLIAVAIAVRRFRK